MGDILKLTKVKFKETYYPTEENINIKDIINIDDNEYEKDGSYSNEAICKEKKNVEKKDDKNNAHERIKTKKERRKERSDYGGLLDLNGLRKGQSLKHET